MVPLANPATLTPTLSRKREREQRPADERIDSPLLVQGMEEHPIEGGPGIGSLSRSRERARVRARTLRKNQTDAEALLWSKLRSRQVLGLKFRRQHSVGKYFADFACIEIALIVELDGGQHTEQAALAYDQARTETLALMGYQVLRFWDNDVLTHTDAVLEKIWNIAQTLTPTLSRKRERE